MEKMSNQDQEIIDELNFILGNSVVFIGTFIVGGVFEEALGKFPVGTVNNYIYLDSENAFQHIVQ